MASQAASPEQDFKLTVHWLESSRAQRVLVLLEELNLKYEIKTYKRSKDGLAPPELQDIHPLGKSPVVVIEARDQTPLVLAESAIICTYVADHWGKHLIPEKYVGGKEGLVNGETEEWMRNSYFTHYIEGSLMSLLGIAAVIRNIRNAPVPFFVKPITRMIAGKISEGFLDPNFKSHFDFLEAQLNTAPNGGGFLCGKDLTIADIMMIFPLEASKEWAGLSQSRHPKLCAYLNGLTARESAKRAERRIIEVAGSFKPVF